MILKEILQKIVDDDDKILLCENGRDWEASELLESLSEPRLRVLAHLQPGLYVAEISEKGYLGRVLYKLKAKA